MIGRPGSKRTSPAKIAQHLPPIAGGTGNLSAGGDFTRRSLLAVRHPTKMNAGVMQHVERGCGVAGRADEIADLAMPITRTAFDVVLPELDVPPAPEPFPRRRCYRSIALIWTRPSVIDNHSGVPFPGLCFIYERLMW